MNANSVAQAIQLVIAPSVMLSSCIVFLNLTLGRYLKISDRLRGMTRERIDILNRYDPQDHAYRDGLSLIDKQLIQLADRYSSLQKASLVLYVSIVLFLLSMMAIGLSINLYPLFFSFLAMAMFLLGSLALLTAIILAMSEVSVSHRAVRAEVRWAMSLKPDHQEAA
jgi:hypothetical protein